MTATLVASTAVFGAVQTAQAEPVNADGGTVQWGFRQSFREYILGPIAHGTIDVVAPATQLPPEDPEFGIPGSGPFQFPVSGGSYDADTAAADASTGGSVRFTGHDGELDLTLANFRVQISGTSGTLYVDITTPGGTGTDVPLATLNLSTVTPVVTEDTVTYNGIVARITAEGAQYFLADTDGDGTPTPMYAVNSLLDPVGLTLSLEDAPPPPPPPPPPPVGELVWRFSQAAQTSSSLNGAHRVDEPATVVNPDDPATRAFSFPATSASYDPITGATVVQFAGTVLVGNNAQGGYQLGIVDPRIVVDATGAGRFLAHGIYRAAATAPYVTSLEELTILEFQVGACDVADTGSSVSATFRAAPWRSPLEGPFPSDIDRFHPEYVSFLETQSAGLANWVRANGTSQLNVDKEAAPLHVAFDYTPSSQVDGVDIITDVAPGALVISVANDEVVLPTPALNSAGSALYTSGQLGGVRVVDTRATDPGWQVNAQLTDFAGPGGTTVSGANLGWTPELVAASTGQTVTLGAAVAPGVGLGGTQLATAAAGAGVGTADLDALLELVLPTATEPGAYEATLTLTAI